MTNLEAANKALALLGVAPIADMEQDTHNARVMNRLFELARQSVLADYPWKFALKTEKLSFIEHNIDSDWPYTFQKPTSTNVWGVFAPRYEGIHYYIEGDSIYACVPDILVEYSEDIPFENWDPATQEIFCYKLAADGAAILTGSEAVAQAALQKYLQLGIVARRNSADERHTDHIHSGNYIRVRGFRHRG